MDDYQDIVSRIQAITDNMMKLSIAREDLPIIKEKIVDNMFDIPFDDNQDGTSKDVDPVFHSLFMVYLKVLKREEELDAESP